MRFIVVILLLWFVPISILAQELSTQVERDQMLIGEINHLIIEHKGALKQSDLLEFKFLDAKSSQTTEKAKAIEVEVYDLQYTPDIIKIQFTVWDSALVVLPPFALSKSSSFTSQALLFQVNFPQIDENGDIADIYELNFEASDSSELLKKFWWLVDLLVLILFIIGLLLVLRVKELEEINKPIIQLSAEERALQDLEQLIKRKQFVGDEQKIHFATFSDILRTYIGRSYNFVTFEKTTHEITEKLRRLNIKQQFVAEFSELLQLSDMIKFSKATTDEVEIERSYNAARALIVETTKIQESQKLEDNQQSTKTEKGEGDA
jgi:hypothetical protein